MFKEIFRTVPLSYWKEGEHWSGLHFEWGTWGRPAPYIETVYYALGILNTTYPGYTDFDATIQTASGDTSIYFISTMSSKYHPGWDVDAWRYDGLSGKEVAKYDIEMVGSALAAFYLTTSRSGAFWQSPGGGSMTLQKWHLPPEMITASGETSGEDKNVAPPKQIAVKNIYLYDETVPNRFEGLGNFSYPYGIDEMSGENYQKTMMVGRFLHPHGAGLGVWEWMTGVFLYDLAMPDSIMDIALEGTNHAYILLANRTVVLIDYIRGEVLGAGKIPPLQTGPAYGAGFPYGVRVTWDYVHRRLLLFERTPDNADGSSTCIIRGYRMVPEPHRITPAIPLRVPRQGRVIPALIQVVGDSNEGVGQYVLDVQVTGSGSLVGVPLSDHMGNTTIQIACEGSIFFGASGASDWMLTGSPDALPYPHTGLVNVLAKATVWQPDPADIPISGAPGGGGTGGPGPPGTDGGGGTTPPPGGTLPKEAPNMKYILEQVYNSQVWNFAEYNQQNPDGRGAFTEKAVQAIHDVDARFGHIKKHAPHTMYNGHAVDALNFKNDDGTTAEIYDIASDHGIGWHFDQRSEKNLTIWYYPA